MNLAQIKNIVTATGHLALSIFRRTCMTVSCALFTVAMAASIVLPIDDQVITPFMNHIAINLEEFDIWIHPDLLDNGDSNDESYEPTETDTTEIEYFNEDRDYDGGAPNY